MQRLFTHAAALFLLGISAAAHAHFPSGYDLRALHVVRSPSGLDAYYRLTLPLVVANSLGHLRADGIHEAAPYTILRVESAHAFYYPDVERIRADPLALGQIIADGHRLEVDGTLVHPRVVSVRVYPKGSVPPFNTLVQARDATAPGPAYPANAPEVDAAYVMVDTHVVYEHAGGGAGFTLSSTLNNRVLGQPDVQNLIVDDTDGRMVVYRATGRLLEPITVNPSAWQAALTFTRAGIAHIASGADHLLFVLCLALGAATLGTLVWRVTGFTLGHSITLAAGFFGYVPKVLWFVPAVETAIAASIVVAAIAALRAVGRAPMFALTCAIGLVHGLGFSFTLREMLQLDGPHLLLSLAAFNVGVEIGQIVFASLVWLAMAWLTSHAVRWQPRVRALVALSCIAVASLWIVERAKPIVALVS
jgi:hypothetical protein